MLNNAMDSFEERWAKDLERINLACAANSGAFSASTKQYVLLRRRMPLRWQHRQHVGLAFSVSPCKPIKLHLPPGRLQQLCARQLDPWKQWPARRVRSPCTRLSDRFPGAAPAHIPGGCPGRVQWPGAGRGASIRDAAAAQSTITASYFALQCKLFNKAPMETGAGRLPPVLQRGA